MSDSFGRTVHEKCEGIHRKKKETWLGLSEQTECIGVFTTEVTSGGKVVCTVIFGNQTNSKSSASNSGSGVLLNWELTRRYRLDREETLVRYSAYTHLSQVNCRTNDPSLLDPGPVTRAHLNSRQ